jgi:hypothetical protein
MTNEQKISIAEGCGLQFVGFDDEGTPEFLGTEKRFKNFYAFLEKEEALDSQK